MKQLALAVIAFAIGTAVAAAISGDMFLYLVAGAAAVCGWTTWRSASVPHFLQIFIAIFSTETVIFGLAVVVARLELWPERFAALAIPDELPVSVAVFSILVYVIGRLPGLRSMIGIASLYYNADDRGTARIWPFPAFAARERNIAVAMVVFLVLVNQAQVAITVRLSFFNRDWFNAIQEKNAGAFWAQLFTVFMPWALIYVTSAVIEFVVQSMLVIRWRRWLTRYYVGHWLDGHAHYRMSLTGNNADNPDQRIAEDVNRFIEGGGQGYGIYSYSILLISTLSSLVSFALVLWKLSGNFAFPGTDVAIPGFLFWVALLYATVGTVITHFIGRALVPLSFQRQRVEADFRFSLARLREYSEQVALLDGERAEKASLAARFAAIIANYLQIVDLKKRLMAFTSTYGQVSPIIPYVFSAPFYFAGKITLGVMTQTASAFSRVEGALTFFITYYSSLAEFRAVSDRLSSFDASIFRARAAGEGGPQRIAGTDSGVVLQNVTIALPDGRTVTRDATVRFAPGERVLLSGPSGTGKSTLLRVIAGLWPYGAGTVTVPADAHVMVVPQKPYIPHGSLRASVTYPDAPEQHGDTEISDALRKVRLESLAGQLDTQDTWSQRLSGGEQQRLAIARALLAKPDWLFLDEATTAMDDALEVDIYRALREALPNTTVVSIGHRSTLGALHDRQLVMTPSPDGTFMPQERRAAAE